MFNPYKAGVYIMQNNMVGGGAAGENKKGEKKNE